MRLNQTAACCRGAEDAVAALVAWPGLARPPTPGGADTAKAVDGRHKPALGRAKGWARGAGHDTGASGPALSAPRRTSRAMTGRRGRCVSTKLRLAVAENDRTIIAHCDASFSSHAPGQGHRRGFDNTPECYGVVLRTLEA